MDDYKCLLVIDCLIRCYRLMVVSLPTRDTDQLEWSQAVRDAEKIIDEFNRTRKDGV